MEYGGMYFNPKIYLPYQRNFIFINSERSIGKTYTTLGFFIDRYFSRSEKFVYICRTQDQKSKGIFKKAFNKVMIQEFPEESFRFTSDTCTHYTLDEKGKMQDEDWVGSCVALSEVNKNKMINLPNVRWIIFDEYIIDDKYNRSEYVGGANEPDLLLKLYHTIDRENDYVTVFFLANAISFYNPYHLHPAFRIPPMPKGEIWTSDNVLYHWTEGSQALKEKKRKSKFINMIKDTEYGEYAVEGEYVADDLNYIEPRPHNSRFKISIKWMGNTYGLWYVPMDPLIYVDDTIDKSVQKQTLCYDKRDMAPGCILVPKSSAWMRWLIRNYRGGNLVYCNAIIKAGFEPLLHILVGR